MARKRMIDPSLWQSEDFSKLSILARLIWIGLFSNADDEGRGRANPVYIKSTLFAYDEDISLAKITKSLAEIEQSMSITMYEIDGKKYYQLESWAKFQVINRPSPSQIPPKNGAFQDNHGVFSEYSVNNHKQITDGSLLNRKEIEIEDNKERKSVKKESPTLDEIKEYARLRGRPDLAVKFYEYYTEGNWVDAKGQSVRNWKQKFLTWCNKTKQDCDILHQRDYTTEDFNSVFDNFKELEIGGVN